MVALGDGSPVASSLHQLLQPLLGPHSYFPFPHVASFDNSQAPLPHQLLLTLAPQEKAAGASKGDENNVLINCSGVGAEFKQPFCLSPAPQSPHTSSKRAACPREKDLNHSGGVEGHQDVGDGSGPGMVPRALPERGWGDWTGPHTENLSQRKTKAARDKGFSRASG